MAGTVLGTAAYMSPEQAKGKKLDKRGDIWSWGVVVYELLTGERLFKGEDAADTLAAVIHKQADLSKVPVRVRRLLGRCLEKDPQKRLRHIGDAAELLEEPPAPAPAPNALDSKPGSVIVAWVVAGLLGSASSHARVRAFSRACSGCAAHAPIHTRRAAQNRSR